MVNNCANSWLPAGLSGGGSEVFFVEGQAFLMSDGNRYNYDSFPPAVINLIDRAMDSKPYVKVLLNQLNITNKDDRRMSWMRCNLSGYDTIADISADYTEIRTEYVPCNNRGTCPHEGKFCQGLQVDNGTLSIRELRILGLIREGMLDKEIGEMLFISVDTVKTTKRNIQKKLGVERKAALANAAAKYGVC
jgi:DNA-binding CsgD family transcriptional regulator